MIPQGLSLEIEDFEQFYVQRKAMLTERVRELLKYNTKKITCFEGDMMQNMLIGNGINIQFGGRAYTSNFIRKRIKYRAISGNYDGLFGEEITANEIVKLLDGFVDEANQIIEGHYDEYIDNIETAEAVQDFKNRYSSKIENSHDIMLEDWFLVVHIFFLKNIDLTEHRISAIQGFEHLILDAIFNGGNIQKIHLKMGINNKVRKFFKRFDNIFTLNYDNYIENLKVIQYEPRRV